MHLLAIIVVFQCAIWLLIFFFALLLLLSEICRKPRFLIASDGQNSILDFACKISLLCGVLLPLVLPAVVIVSLKVQFCVITCSSIHIVVFYIISFCFPINSNDNGVLLSFGLTAIIILKADKMRKLHFYLGQLFRLFFVRNAKNVWIS